MWGPSTPPSHSLRAWPGSAQDDSIRMTVSGFALSYLGLELRQ